MIAALAALFCGLADAVADENVLANPDFELLNPAGDNFPLDWSPDKDPTGKSGAVIDGRAHSGGVAIRLFASADSVARLNSSRINVRSGKVRFWYKALASDAAGANLGVQEIGRAHV